MGVKSTREITYKQALDFYVHFKEKIYKMNNFENAITKELKEFWREEVKKLDKYDFELLLEKLDDADNGGESFNNYLIIDFKEKNPNHLEKILKEFDL